MVVDVRRAQWRITGCRPSRKTRAGLEGALEICSTAYFRKLTDIGDHSPIIASFEIDGQSRTG